MELETQFNTAVILTAGKNSRFWPLASEKHKCMYEAGAGKPILWHTLKSLREVGIKKTIIVIPEHERSIPNYFEKEYKKKDLDMHITYLIQKQPLGMGDALLQTKNILKGDYFYLVNPDKINAGEIIRKMNEKFCQNFQVLLASRVTNEPWNYGILEIENEEVKKIIEKPQKAADNSQRIIGVYLLPDKFLKTLERAEPNYYNFENALQRFIQEYGGVGNVDCGDISEITLKYPWHLLQINSYLMNRFRFSKPIIGENVQIKPGAIIEGPVIIENGVQILHHAAIKGLCFIGEKSIIGDKSLIRGCSYIGRNVIVGCGTEIKNSLIYDGVKTHRNFIGDSVIDENCSFGAGTITANRRLDKKTVSSAVGDDKINTELKYFGAIFGKNVQTGILAGIMPGIKAGRGSQIGSHTNVIKDIPEKTLVYSLSKLRQVKV